MGAAPQLRLLDFVIAVRSGGLHPLPDASESLVTDPDSMRARRSPRRPLPFLLTLTCAYDGGETDTPGSDDDI